MTWEFSTDESGTLLIVKTKGVLEISDAIRMREEGFALIRANNYRGCLLDHSEIEADSLGTLDIYQLPNKYHELGVSPLFRLAAIVNRQVAENLHFYETVCRNNGYSVSVFFSRPEALAWLRS